MGPVQLGNRAIWEISDKLVHKEPPVVAGWSSVKTPYANPATWETPVS